MILKETLKGSSKDPQGLYEDLKRNLKVILKGSLLGSWKDPMRIFQGSKKDL